MSDSEYGDFSDEMCLERSVMRQRRLRSATNRQRRELRRDYAKKGGNLQEWRQSELYDMNRRDHDLWVQNGAVMKLAGRLFRPDEDRLDMVRAYLRAARRGNPGLPRRRFPKEWKQDKCNACSHLDNLVHDFISGVTSDNSWWNHQTLCRRCHYRIRQARATHGYEGLRSWAREYRPNILATWTPDWWAARETYYN